WLMVAIVRASPRNRSANPCSSSRAGSRIFTATVRPSTSSVPRHTSPMPPPAIRSSKRYRPPSIVPGLNIVDTSLQAPFGDDRLHDLAADPGGLAAATRSGVLKEHGHGDDRFTVLHGEPDEPAVVLGAVAVLRGTGLPTDLEAGDLRLGAGTVLHDALHHVLQLTGDLTADRLPELVRRGRVVDGRPVGGQFPVDEVRPHLRPAVRDRGRDQGALQRRH